MHLHSAIRPILVAALFLLLHNAGFSQVSEPDTNAVVRGKGALKGNQPAVDTVRRMRSIVERSDTPVGIDKDSLRAIERKEFLMSRNSKTAVRRSLILPGWGQAYMHKYWKMPIIYAGFATFGYFIVDNNRQFQIYKQAVKCRAYGTCADLFPDDSKETLISNREYYRKFRDLNVIFAGLWYTLQAVDAYVDGHMAAFDVSEELGFDVGPSLQFDPRGGNNVYSGITLNFTFNK
jgi:hypothetical protein